MRAVGFSFTLINCRCTQILTRNLRELFGSDGKCQVSVKYDDNDRPKEIITIVVSQQTKSCTSREFYTAFILNECIKKVIPQEMITSETKILINPTGEFVKGGSYADSGLTVRKIICGTYGGVSRHGGGAFCVGGDSEYLSPNGWIKIKDYIGGKVAQWDSGKLTFVNPKFYHVSDAKNMYHIRNGRFESRSEFKFDENGKVVKR